MSVYDEKIYPTLPSAPPDQVYRLKKIDEMEKFLRDEVEYRDTIAKRCKRRATAMTISDHSVLTAITALEIGSVVTLSTGIGIPISIALASAGFILGLSTVIIHKTQKIFDCKTKKHEKIKILAEAKLDSISGLISKAVEDASISLEEFQFILKEIEHYRVLKEQIRSKTKHVVDTISDEQKEEILAEGRKQGKQDFLDRIAVTSGIPRVSAT